MNVIWSFHAQDQEAAILRYLAVKMSLADAIRWAHRFHDDAERLAAQPHLGHPVRPAIFSKTPLLVERIHEIFSGNYRILYEIADDTIRILSLTHSSWMVDGDCLVWDK